MFRFSIYSLLQRLPIFSIEILGTHYKKQRGQTKRTITTMAEQTESSGNIVKITIKTPKDKKIVELDGSVTVKEVCSLFHK